MTAWLDPPHGALLDAAESMALAALDGGASGFGDFGAWLGGCDPALPLNRLADGFGLDTAATALLALLFAAALSEPVARAVESQAGEGPGVPVWLARRMLPDLRAETFAAAGALRHYGLIEIDDGPRVAARLRLREALLDRFCGLAPREPEVAARIAALNPDPDLSSAELALRLQGALAARGRDRLSPVVLAGGAEPGMLAASLAALGLAPHRLGGGDIPEDPETRDRLARLWSRDAALDKAALLIDAGDRAAVVGAFADAVAGHVVVLGAMAAGAFQRGVYSVAEPERALPPAERWQLALGAKRSAKLGGGVARVAAQFRLPPAEIGALCAQLAFDIDAAPDAAAATAALWHGAAHAVPILAVPGVLVVEPSYRWSDIVLPTGIEAALRRVETHVLHATTVLDDWGFAERMGGRGRGVAALFAGPSGTGKTMAAEVLASSLDLRMMLIDLSQIISKYVGETSKNIAAAFDQAERTGAVMVWNEGDAIWGTRGSVGNATDRHVNAETGDLLQRIEAFRGFTIVTTNLRHAIDPAFLRRFRFAIDFPIPSERERLQLWQQAFPGLAPVEKINWAGLAGLPLSGGSIRNIALGSAFLAAASGGPIRQAMISAELAEELRKHNQPLPAIDWGTPQ